MACHVQEENRARDLFYGLWTPDLFMKRVQDNGTWSLFCPNEAPGLADCWGDEFEKLYIKYEREVGLDHIVGFVEWSQNGDCELGYILFCRVGQRELCKLKSSGLQS